MPASKILAVRRHFIPGSSILSTPYRHTQTTFTQGLADRHTETGRHAQRDWETDTQRMADRHKGTGRQTHMVNLSDELRFYVPHDTKYVIFVTFFPANLLP